MCQDVQTSCLGMSHLYDSFARFVHIFFLLFFFYLISATLCRRHVTAFSFGLTLIRSSSSTPLSFCWSVTGRIDLTTPLAHLRSILSQRSGQRFTTPLWFIVMAVEGLVTTVLFVCALFVRSLHRLSARRQLINKPIETGAPF
ncbi:uncharacterized protein LOC143920898 [Arctopsyche grandis]|uniref:uncharacterized protein LOC143920898 n=1 Tax=Arctopsyche grandis TaxID=121162 RepID=UPI00406D6AE0